MAGRKPLPTHLKMVRGTLQKCRMNPDEPTPDPEIPDAPPHLSPEAREEWERLALELYELGILSTIDRAALAAYCQAYGRWVEAEEQLRNIDGTMKLTETTSNGNIIQNPLVGIANKSLDAQIFDRVRHVPEQPYPCQRKEKDGREKGLRGLVGNIMAKEPTYPHVEAALRYARDVVAGRILACQWVILACKRQLDDLERWDGVDGAPYFFDRAAAERVIKFEEMMPHVKGEWARKRMTLKLEPWQKFILSTLFGWKRAKDGLRRFREAYIEVPRKNGKSCFVAPMGLYMLVADGEEGAEVYSGATTEKQAWEVYGPARIMAKRAEGFMEHYGVDVRAKNMNLIGSASRFEPLIGDPGDGASPHCAIVDEYHEHDSPRLYDTMITGMGARRQPLIIVITTAGFNLGGPCYDMRLRAGKVLDRTLQDEELFAVVYTIDAEDDWKSPEALRKANPNFGVSVMEDYLLAQQLKAIQNPSKQNTFKTKHLNVWCNARAAAFNMTNWEKCAEPGLSRERFAGKPCFMGLDLASKGDLNAVVYLFPEDGGTYALFADFFLPEDALESTQNADIYRGWASEGWITLTPGGMVDYDTIEEHILEQAKRFEVRECPYDPYQAAQLVTHLADSGLTMVEFGATVKNFSDPFKTLIALVDAGKIRHDGNPVLTWCMSNTVCFTDAKDNIYPRKDRYEYKIDGAVAAIMALGRAHCIMVIM